jgi:V8-like Glu-specific endopeptidase
MHARLSGSAIVIIAIATSAVLSGPSVAAVFGRDDRTRLPASLKGLERSVGLFFNIKSKTACTAFCVGDAIIATAGHCLAPTQDGAVQDTRAFYFGAPRGDPASFAQIAGHETRTTDQNVRVGRIKLSVKPPIDAALDWAFVRLDRAACKGAVLPVKSTPHDHIVSSEQAGAIFQVAFHRDRQPWPLLLATNCDVTPVIDDVWRAQVERDFASPHLVMFHQCDTAGASSGSPMLVETPTGPIVIGINVGSYVKSRIVEKNGTVIHRAAAQPIANTAVSAQAFKAALEQFVSDTQPQDLVMRSSRAASSGDKGAGIPATDAVPRLPRHNINPAIVKSTTGVAHSRSVDRSTGGRRSTNVP